MQRGGAVSRWTTVTGYALLAQGSRKFTFVVSLSGISGNLEMSGNLAKVRERSGNLYRKGNLIFAAQQYNLPVLLS